MYIYICIYIHMFIYWAHEPFADPARMGQMAGPPLRPAEASDPWHAGVWRSVSAFWVAQPSACCGARPLHAKLQASDFLRALRPRRPGIWAVFVSPVPFATQGLHEFRDYSSEFEPVRLSFERSTLSFSLH